MTNSKLQIKNKPYHNHYPQNLPPKITESVLEAKYKIHLHFILSF